MFWSVMLKSLKEQLRSFWILILTVTLAPFFVLVYYMINEAEQESYTLLILNQDEGVVTLEGPINVGSSLCEHLDDVDPDSLGLPLTITLEQERSKAVGKLEDRKADALIVIPDDFSESTLALMKREESAQIPLEIVGDLTSVGYMVTAVWVNEIISEYVHQVSGIPRPVAVTETALGLSGDLDDFDFYMPGIMILAVIMLMFTATIAIITEVDQKTILRLKLSRLSGLTFLSGVGLIQILVGLVSILLTLTTALGMGFDMRGSFWNFLLLATLTSISIIAFSLLLAAFVKSVNEVLIVGNFPLFLFMFFTGAAFPMNPKTLFEIGGYEIGWSSFMSATHAVDAMRKIMVMEQNLGDILPEIIAILACTGIYFMLGVWAFQRRHLRVE